MFQFWNIGEVNTDEFAEQLPANVSPWMHCTAGAVAGFSEHSIMYPVDFAKTRLMSVRSAVKSVSRSLLNAVRQEGIMRPLRGISVVALSAGPAHGLYYASYEFTKKLLSDHSKTSGQNVLPNGAAAVVATLAHDAIMVPADTLKQQIQRLNSPHRSFSKCMVVLIRTGGVRSLYRSFWTQAIMNVPFQVVHFVTYELMKDALSDYGNRTMVHLTSGGIAGGLAAAITTPLDVCKTIINTQEQVNGKQARNLRQAIKLIIEKMGPRGFMLGMRARVMFAAPSTAISWSVYEFFKLWLSN